MKKDQLRLKLVGLTGSGKTSFLHCFLYGRFKDNVSSTAGYDYWRCQKNGISYDGYDLAGAECNDFPAFSHIRLGFFESSLDRVLTLWFLDASRLDDSIAYMERIIKKKNKEVLFPVYLIVNKIDLLDETRGAAPEFDGEASQENGSLLKKIQSSILFEYCDVRGYAFCSVKENKGLDIIYSKLNEFAISQEPNFIFKDKVIARPIVRGSTQKVFIPMSSASNLSEGVGSSSKVFIPISSASNLAEDEGSSSKVFIPIFSASNLAEDEGSSSKVFIPISSASNLSEGDGSLSKVFIPIFSASNLAEDEGSSSKVFIPIADTNARSPLATSATHYGTLSSTQSSPSFWSNLKNKILGVKEPAEETIELRKT